jgi:hypothetical protein
MSLSILKVPFNGWTNNYLLSNGQVEVVITADVGPRILRFGFKGGRNVLCEMPGQQGNSGEKDWQIRGGHRLWLAPEAKPWSYELDNVPVNVTPILDGVRTIQAPGKISGIQKMMEITLSPKRNELTVVHLLKNTGRKAVSLAPWALTVMAKKGMAIIPLPAKIAHSQRLTHNQEWSIWGYTDFTDPRWTLGSRYLFFRQDPRRGPNKLGIAHREKWIGYLLDNTLFVKRFDWVDGATYPDGGVNFETFSNEDILELESLGPLVRLPPGRTVCHQETWQLFDKVPAIRTEADVDRKILPLLKK